MAKSNLSSRRARRIAFCGVFAALSMVILYIGGFTVLDLSILVICSLVTAIVAVETGAKTGWLYAAVTSALALILLPEKLYAIEYIFFSAVYPMVRPLFSRFPARLAFVLRVAVLEAMLCICISLGQFVLMVGDEFFTLGSVTLIGGCAFFILYEFALSRVMVFYFVKVRNKLRLNRFL